MVWFLALVRSQILHMTHNKPREVAPRDAGVAGTEESGSVAICCADAALVRKAKRAFRQNRDSHAE